MSSPLMHLSRNENVSRLLGLLCMVVSPMDNVFTVCHTLILDFWTGCSKDMSVISVCMCLRIITNRKTGKSASAACLFGAKQLRCLLDMSVTSLCLHFHKEVNLSCSTATTAALRSRCAESPLEAVPNVTAKKKFVACQHCSLRGCPHCLSALHYFRCTTLPRRKV
jgi:hypothetical protein